MLYRVGTASEIESLHALFPERVIEEVLTGAVVRDAEYGSNRDYTETGGYSILAETKDDMQELKKIVDIDSRPCEWVTCIGSTEYISALYILNDDFTIDVFMPQAVAPKVLLNDLEDL